MARFIRETERLIERLSHRLHLDPTRNINWSHSLQGQYDELQLMLDEHEKQLKREIIETSAVLVICAVAMLITWVETAEATRALVGGLAFLIVWLKLTFMAKERIQYHYLVTADRRLHREIIDEYNEYIDATQGATSSTVTGDDQN